MNAVLLDRLLPLVVSCFTLIFTSVIPMLMKSLSTYNFLFSASFFIKFTMISYCLGLLAKRNQFLSKTSA